MTGSATLSGVSSILAASGMTLMGQVPEGLSSTPANDSLLGGRVLPSSSSLVTYYVSDAQFEYLGARGFTHNPLLKWFFEPADRNAILTQTAPLWVDELLRHVKADHQGRPQAIEVKGDTADTPLQTEVRRLETIIGRQEIHVEGYTRGNHSSGNIFGVINLASPWYERIRNFRWWPLSLFRFSLDEQLEGAAGTPGEILNQKATMDSMHRIVSHHREDRPFPKRLTTAVHKADYDGYELLSNEESSERVAFSRENLDRNFKTFWKPTRGTELGLTRETRFWECIINYDIADQKHRYRGTDVNPLYLQASETARFRAEDEKEYPVFTISIDGLDHRNLLTAVGAGVSEFQVRLIETFMDRMLLENPRARFKISSHFSAQDLVSVPWYMPWRRRRGAKAREAFRRLLAREEVILYSFGHTHARNVTDLNKDLKLGRKSSLTEINVPSLIDYHPNKQRHNGEYHDARALVVEKLKLAEEPGKPRRLVIDLEYRGLDARDVREGRTPEVEAALKDFDENHGYNRAQETVKVLRNQHLFGFCYSHLKRLGEFVVQGFLQLPFRPRRWWRYWKDLSIGQYLVDNFTVVSTVNQFNEAYHMIAFLESVARFIGPDAEPGQLAVRGQILGLRTALMENAYKRQHEFEEALSSGRRPGELKQYNDLFLRARTYVLPDLLLRLKPGSPARTFAVLASIQASREEFLQRRFLFSKVKPTDVPNEVPSIEIPFDDPPKISRAGGAI